MLFFNIPIFYWNCRFSVFDGTNFFASVPSKKQQGSFVALHMSNGCSQLKKASDHSNASICLVQQVFIFGSLMIH